jgi:hypothetical protein
MRSEWGRPALWVMFAIIVADYVAQIPYYLRLYYFPHHAAPSLFGTLGLAMTLAWFLVGFALLLRGRPMGYWLTLTFLVTETGFYLYNNIAQVAHGYPPFFHLANPDPILWTVFAIGYLNMLAGVVFIAALLFWRGMRPLATRRSS